ncbi:hypothetical protein CXF72_09200 [Psychromonas sp. MB-3u-54]|nr:hypothetical protein CXF72_09200 [Psychromonas sp. MB-3u-54]
MPYYLFLSVIWGALGIFFFFFYLVEIIQLYPFNDTEVIAEIMLMLLSATSVFVSAFWLWRGLTWAKFVMGFIAVVFALGCGMAIWVRDWWGASGILDVLLVSCICLSFYTLYVFLTRAPTSGAT